MNPATIIEQAAMDGVILSLPASGHIKATGKQENVEKWIPTIREHKIRLVALLSESGNAVTDDSPISFRWLIHFGNRDSVVASFSPEVTRIEVQASYPGTVAAEPDRRQPIRSATHAETEEIQKLLATIYQDDTDAERTEALDAALVDPESSLICYRAIASERAVVPPVTGPGKVQ